MFKMGEKAEEGSRTWVKLTGRFGKKLRQQDPKTEEADSDRSDSPEEAGRRLSVREEELLSRVQPDQEGEDLLCRDLELLKLQILTTVRRSFAGDPDADLASAVAVLRQQETLDRHREGGGCRWRPLKCLGAHNALLADVAEFRLAEAARDADRDGAGGLSTPLKRQVCGAGKRVKEDLLRCARTLQPCYDPDLDVLNIYAGLCHQSFAARLSDAVQAGPDVDECAYLLFWVNTFYPREILKHEELRGKLKSDCLGALLPREQVRQLEERVAKNKEERLCSWLHKVLQREEENWSGGKMPEVIDDFFFCPLAVDVIQVIDGSLADSDYFSGGDRTDSRWIAAHLENFLLSYKKSLEKLSQGNDEHATTWMKAHLACQEQLRDYVGRRAEDQPGSQESGRCEAILDELRDFVSVAFTRPIHEHLKVYYRQLWTPGWCDGSLPVMDSLLEVLFHVLDQQLTHLKASCKQSLTRTFRRELEVEYARRMTKSRLKGEQDWAAAARRMLDDARKMDDFFRVAGCDESRCFGQMPVNVEAPHLGSIRKDMLAFARKFLDFRCKLSDPASSTIVGGAEEVLTPTDRKLTLFFGPKARQWLRSRLSGNY
ncbi:tumor necrosis factor alpha-induced protein 2-like [Corythoichthys intestinalis]|uniref:tumor necrosis factor alpha-induced protein 2-like n=1 Tax=Corythoichthys intestinalis TaxID=161448 RepID=UPI0025A55283|nr:tumor necrosis factor alpha-induced protein 2-like [Corythoichthys intestinalis]